jgi:hypothetical protein
MELVYCMHCGQKIAADAQFCPHCGGRQTQPDAAAPHSPTAATPAASPAVPPASTVAAPLPPGVARWSWGAFWLNWIWAIFNRVWIGLLALIPLVNIVMAFVLGFKGREWAWKSGRWQSVEHFEQVQRKWNLAGWIVIAVALVLGIGLGAMEDHMKRAPKDRPAATQDWDLSDPKPAAEPPAKPARSESPYPMPHMRFEATDLMARLMQLKIDPVWTKHFTDYLIDPPRFWQECLASEAATAQTQGGMKAADAQRHALNTCSILAAHHYDCLNNKPLDEAAMCLYGYINDVAMNGD